MSICEEGTRGESGWCRLSIVSLESLESFDNIWLDRSRKLPNIIGAAHRRVEFLQVFTRKFPVSFSRRTTLINRRFLRSFYQRMPRYQVSDRRCGIGVPPSPSSTLPKSYWMIRAEAEDERPEIALIPFQTCSHVLAGRASTCSTCARLTPWPSISAATSLRTCT